MNKKLTPKQQRFVDEYQIDLNATQAAIRAGYATGKSAEVQGVRLLGNAKVAKAISDAQERRSKRLEVDADRILRELMRIGMSDVRKLFTEDGQLRLPNDFDDDIAAAIASIEVVTHQQPGGSDKTHIEHVHKIKLWDKNAALDKLMRHLGAYAPDKVDHSNTDGSMRPTTIEIVGVSPDDKGKD